MEIEMTDMENSNSAGKYNIEYIKSLNILPVFAPVAHFSIDMWRKFFHDFLSLLHDGAK